MRPGRRVVRRPGPGSGLAAGGCGEPCCLTDSRPVPLLTGPAGELMVRVATTAGSGGRPGRPRQSHHVVEPPGSAGGHASGICACWARPTPATTPPLRAFFRDVQVVESPLGPIGTESRIAGARRGHRRRSARVISRSRSVSHAPEMIFWSRQSANDGFLGAAGYAVLRLPRRGGGRLEVTHPARLAGAPLAAAKSPASRLIMRACAAPDAFRREDPLPALAARRPTYQAGPGTNSVAVAVDRRGADGAGASGLAAACRNDLPCTGGADAAPAGRRLTRPSRCRRSWTSIPRLALIDREADFVNDPGPCAELARARRTEQVALLQSQNPELAPCAPHVRSRRPLRPGGKQRRLPRARRPDRGRGHRRRHALPAGLARRGSTAGARSRRPHRCPGARPGTPGDRLLQRRSPRDLLLRGHPARPALVTPGPMSVRV